MAQNTAFMMRRNILGDLMPDILVEDDFSTFVVKWVILDTFQDYQVRAFCAFENESAWKTIEEQHTIARTCKKWLDAQEESLRQGRRHEPFTLDVRYALLKHRPAFDIPIVRAFMRHLSPRTNASEPDKWREHLVYALVEPMISVVIKCHQLEKHILETDEAFYFQKFMEQMREAGESGPEMFEQVFGEFIMRLHSLNNE
ncbi:hypothetical protein E2P81_ATG00480 [Venturia nashicola]|uniref:Uncharacterized protein n=1 Tax=Venturia nashicola TaxID=86259 RepID=A0A4Z1PFI2_9PEZI|nr:hypothetical protein E6O75_ATG00490 [Venturia nashicola]TLD39493.1 hypothetical protein E2P81_ATG00480 [Venturia nashicola]